MPPRGKSTTVADALPAQWRRGVYETIQRRRDVRIFRPDPIPAAALARILGAAHHAPSVGFSQPWNFILIRNLALRTRIQAHVDKERLRAAAGFSGERRTQYLSFKLEGVLDAPLNICVTCDRTRFGPSVLGRHTMIDTDLYSTCAAIQNLWLAARAEGIGVGWVSILRPAWLRRTLEIPPKAVVVAYLCVGYAKSFPRRPMLETAGWLPRMSLVETVFAEKWGQPCDGALARILERASGKSHAESEDNVDGRGRAASKPDRTRGGPDTGQPRSGGRIA